MDVFSGESQRVIFGLASIRACSLSKIAVVTKVRSPVLVNKPWIISTFGISEWKFLKKSWEGISFQELSFGQFQIKSIVL